VSLSVAAIQPPAAIYREEQRFGWWVYTLMLVMMGMAWAVFEGRGLVRPGFFGHRAQQLFLAISAGMALPIIFMLGVLRVEVVQYRPIADCGGWGIRIGKDGERVLNARGNRGVRIHLIDGSRILIGSQRPEELALAVEGALRTGR
jgi:hypothetical protein